MVKIIRKFLTKNKIFFKDTKLKIISFSVEKIPSGILSVNNLSGKKFFVIGKTAYGIVKISMNEKNYLYLQKYVGWKISVRLKLKRTILNKKLKTTITAGKVITDRNGNVF